MFVNGALSFEDFTRPGRVTGLRPLLFLVINTLDSKLDSLIGDGKLIWPDKEDRFLKLLASAVEGEEAEDE